MKKHVLTIVVFLLLGIPGAHAQFWNLSGNTPSGSDFIGSTGSTDVIFKTSNTDRMHLFSSGELGIGITASPASLLHVYNASSRETFRTDVASSTDNYWRMLKNGTEAGCVFSPNGSNLFTVAASRDNLRIAEGIPAL